MKKIKLKEKKKKALDKIEHIKLVEEQFKKR